MAKFLATVFLICTWGLSIVCVYQNDVIQVQSQKIEEQHNALQYLLQQQQTIPAEPQPPADEDPAPQVHIDPNTSVTQSTAHCTIDGKYCMW